MCDGAETAAECNFLTRVQPAGFMHGNCSSSAVSPRKIFALVLWAAATVCRSDNTIMSLIDNLQYLAAHSLPRAGGSRRGIYFCQMCFFVSFVSMLARLQLVK